MQIYNTVNDLKAAILEVDQVVLLKGLSVVGDGLGGLFIIRGPGGADESTEYEIANGNVASMLGIRSNTPIDIDDGQRVATTAYVKSLLRAEGIQNWPYVRKPHTLSPEEGTTINTPYPTLIAGGYADIYNSDDSEHINSRYRVARDIGMTDLVYDSGIVPKITVHQVTTPLPDDMTTYYWDVEFFSRNTASNVSAVSSFYYGTRVPLNFRLIDGLDQNTAYSAVVWAGDRFVCLGTAGQIWISYDGETWVQNQSTIGTGLTGMKYFSENNKIVAFGGVQMWYSDDRGEQWSQRSGSNFATASYDMDYDFVNGFAYFVHPAGSTTYQGIYRFADMNTLAGGNRMYNAALSSVACNPLSGYTYYRQTNGSVGVSFDGTSIPGLVAAVTGYFIKVVNGVLHSGPGTGTSRAYYNSFDDGVTWYYAVLPEGFPTLNNFIAIDNGMIMACGRSSDGVSSHVAYSYDNGANWSMCSVPEAGFNADADLYGTKIAYSPDLKVVVNVNHASTCRAIIANIP